MSIVEPDSDLPQDQLEADHVFLRREQVSYQRSVPLGLRVAAGWAWRLLVLGAAVIGVGYGLRYLSEVFVPIAVALLLTALLSPVVRQLRRWKWPPVLASGVALLGGIIVVAGALTLIGTTIAAKASDLVQQSAGAVTQVLGILSGWPFNLRVDDAAWNDYLGQLKNWATERVTELAGYATDIGSSIGHFVAGLAIALFSTFFFMFEGRRIWRFALNFFPRVARRRVDESARLGWNSLVAFVRTTVIVAFVDAIGVLIVALALQVPVAPALAALVFFGAFIPIVGALVSGFVAVAVALVTLGWVQALIMLAGLVLVMQIEGHVLQPFLMGRAVDMHPLAIILGIAIGIVLGGIVGALIAVPVMAFARTFASHLSHTGSSIDLRAHILV